MRKVLVFSLILILIIVAGCSNKTTIETEQGDVEVEVDKGSDTTTITTDDTTVEVTSDMKESVEVPKDFPQDLLPLYKGMFVALAMENQDGSISLVGMTDDSLEDVVAFYEEVTKDYNAFVKEKSADSYMKMGDYEGMTYTVAVAPDTEEDYETVITLMAIPGGMEGVDMTAPAEENDDSDSESVDSDSDKSSMLDMNDMSIPDEYPVKVMPIINNKDTKVMMSQVSGSDIMLGFMTKDEIDEVVSYYEEILKDAADMSYLEMGPNKMLSGTLDSHHFEMVFTENNQSIGEDPAYKTLIQIMYSKY